MSLHQCSTWPHPSVWGQPRFSRRVSFPSPFCASIMLFVVAQYLVRMSLLNFHQLPASAGGSRQGLQQGPGGTSSHVSHVTLYLKEQLFPFVDPGGRLCAGPLRAGPLLLFTFSQSTWISLAGTPHMGLMPSRSPPSSRPSCVAPALISAISARRQFSRAEVWKPAPPLLRGRLCSRPLRGQSCKWMWKQAHCAPTPAFVQPTPLSAPP